jgi:hypothetical protein
LLLVLAVIAVACSEPAEPAGNDDYERGFQAGYERALETLADCLESSEPGTLGDCVAAYTLAGVPGEVAESYTEDIRLTGILIESEMLVRYR